MIALRKITESGAVHDKREIDAVLEVLNETTLDLGPRVAEFERRGAELLAKQHGVFVNSGSSALRLAVDLLGCAPGDEVITPALTFSTDVAPLVHSGIVPAFVDVEPDTLQIDVSKIEEMIGPRTKGMLIPNLVGNLPDWDAIKTISEQHDLPVIEDSCDVLDSWLRGSRTGERVPITVTSFARSHAMTCAGMGGMIAVDDDDWYDRALVRRRWGRRSESFLYGTRKDDPKRFGTLADGTPYDFIFVFDDAGYNFEPSEIMAAYGLVQMDKLADFNARRRHNFDQLDAMFADHEDLVIRPRTTEGAETIWMRYPFLLPRRHRPNACPGVPRRTQCRHPYGVDRQHPPPARLRRHHASPASRRLARHRPRDGPCAHAADPPWAHERRPRLHGRLSERALPDALRSPCHAPVNGSGGETHSSLHLCEMGWPCSTSGARAPREALNDMRSGARRPVCEGRRRKLR